MPYEVKWCEGFGQRQSGRPPGPGSAPFAIGRSRPRRESLAVLSLSSVDTHEARHGALPVDRVCHAWPHSRATHGEYLQEGLRRELEHRRTEADSRGNGTSRWLVAGPAAGLVRRRGVHRDAVAHRVSYGECAAVAHGIAPQPDAFTEPYALVLTIGVGEPHQYFGAAVRVRGADAGNGFGGGREHSVVGLVGTGGFGSSRRSAGRGLGTARP